MKSSGFFPSLISGACAGFVVDVLLFPLDTVKTRLQSRQGFWKAGGFKGIYNGIGPVFFGSAPGAAMFFVAYDTSKRIFGSYEFMDSHQTLAYMLAACVGEICACIVRVPVEVIKQRSQTMSHISSWSILKSTIENEKIRGLFRGYRSTVLREIPFSFIQFPLWEYSKVFVANRQGYAVTPWQGALCGFFSGGVAAAVTTPLDVAKTTIMLAKKKDEASLGHIVPVLKDIYRRKGVKGLFAGVVPRVIWTSIGGFVFLGTYDFVGSLYGV